MESKLRRGFKTHAERLALEVRSELSLGAYEPLNPRALADHLGIPVVTLEDLTQARPESVRHLTEVAPEEFSAMTVFYGSFRLVVENPVHSLARRTSSLTHELSHVLLEHEPQEALSVGGCRQWSPAAEAEADWLAGVLLVPRKAALRIARARIPTCEAANAFGVSADLMMWRLNHTGALQQARRERALRRARQHAG